MTMNLESLNKLTLIQIAMHDGVDLSLRYAAASEIQMRWSNEMLPTLVNMWGKGEPAWKIAEELGIREKEVCRRIGQYKLRRVSA